MVARLDDPFDVARQIGDRLIEDRQAGTPQREVGIAEGASREGRRRAGEAVGDRLRILGQDVDAEAARALDDRVDAALVAYGDHDQRRVERDARERVDRCAPWLAAAIGLLEGRNDGYAGSEARQHLAVVLSLDRSQIGRHLGRLCHS